MALEDASRGDYTVSFIRKSIVKASGPIPEHHILTLSNLDLLSGRFPVTYFYVYREAKPNDSSASIADELKKSLANCLSHFYPFAGRIIPNPETNEPEIVCDNTGALFLEAQASISLTELDLYYLNNCLEGKLVPINQEFPVQVQLTNYKCGGIFITFTFDHALGDASSFSKFLLMWSEIARKKPLSFSPDHRRYLLRARDPPIYNPSFDQSFISCSLHDIHNILTPRKLLKRLYYVDASSIDRLQKLASIDGTKRTKIEAFSACIWKIMVKAIDKDHHNKCKMGWLVDGRTRICNKNEKVTENYIGNALSIAVGEANVNEIEHGSISDVANNVHNAISKVTSAEHFLDLIDWIEWNKPGLMLSKVVLGQGGPTIVVSSGRRFPVAEVDFGFGTPVLGTVYSTIKKIGVGYINQRPGAKGDGSWTISAILWPEMIEALESDTEHVFQPMTSDHLKII